MFLFIVEMDHNMLSDYQINKFKVAFCSVSIYHLLMQENRITAFTQVCRKRRLKGGFRYFLICVEVVHTNYATAWVNFGLESKM